MTSQVAQWFAGAPATHYLKLVAVVSRLADASEHDATWMIAQCQQLGPIGKAMSKDPKSPDPLTQSHYAEMGAWAVSAARDCRASKLPAVKYDLTQLAQYVQDFTDRLRTLGVTA